MRDEKYIKILVMSDTHGDVRVCNEIIERELPFDYLIHCGDVQADPEAVLDHRESYGLLAVRGNCDWFTSLPEALLRRIGSCNILVVHGHRQCVSAGHELLLDLARKNAADVVLYGHTHRSLVRRYEKQGILVVNPGSLTRSRPAGSAGTYAVLTIPEEGLPEAQIKTVEET